MDDPEARAPGRPAPQPSARSQHGLDWLNFFVADAETAFGPFTSLFLTVQGWQQGTIGAVMSVNSAVALLGQGPAEWLVDASRRKRLVVAVCLAGIAVAALLIALSPHFAAVAVAELLLGVSGSVARTTIAGIAIGLVGLM